MSDRLSPEPVRRRDFLGLSGLWVTAIAGLASLMGMLKLPMPRVTPEASNRFRIGRPEDYFAGSEHVLKDRNVLILSTASGVAAVSMICTHLGCIVARVDNGFACPCHGSKFDDKGDVVGGPAPRGLRWFEVSRSADGSLVVDSDREVSPETYYLA